MTTRPRSDRTVRRTVPALAVVGLGVTTAGAALDAMWLLGMGVWALIAAMVIDIVHQP
ncbi:hypothetical protein [Streptomyces sp. NPDC005533]|uniref:hypothetical protein n=1 Tax=Streptomyces sp. NPDC005533 TaxID=3364723 RepID=UPI0036ABCEBB